MSEEDKRKCYQDCYFFFDKSGTHLEKDRCDLGYNIGGIGECDYIHKDDREKVIRFKINKEQKKIKASYEEIKSSEKQVISLLEELKRVKLIRFMNVKEIEQKYND